MKKNISLGNLINYNEKIKEIYQSQIDDARRILDHHLTNHPSNECFLPNASADVLGGVKIGENLSIDSNGVLSTVSQKNMFYELIEEV